MECIVCKGKLNGNRKKFCSNNCKSKYHYKNSNGYYFQVKRGYSRKLQLLELKGGGCYKCGYNKNIAALEFHHLDPSEKEFQLGSAKTTNLDKLLLEMNKCILVCANCHREIHYPDEIIEQ